jgi:quinol monooxygenase YgiN
MIIVTGAIVARPETFDEILALSREHVARSRLEPGCIEHGAHLDAERPLRIVFFERWSDAAALKAHVNVPASRAFGRAAAALAAEPPTLELFAADPKTAADLFA